MAPIATELATFRALTFRLSSTATSLLPEHVPAIAASLANCRSLLASAHTSGSKASAEASVAVHKYRALLSTLLQDRTVQGRWAAIVLVKATVEIGGWETLQKSLAWVRGLLAILTKPDPPSSKKLCLITLTRIFCLTREYPTLVREITTPSLPTFIQSSLQIATPKAPASLLQAVFESFNQLLPRHPTIFRSYLKQLQQLLGRTIAPTPSSKLGPEQVSGPKFETASEVSAAARRLYTQLPCCAPKGASNEEWHESFKRTVENVHRVSDRVFRAVVEDWRSSVNNMPSLNSHTSDDEVQDLEPSAMALPPWSGIYAGSERLVSLLRLIKDHLDCATAGPISLNVGLTVDLLSRLLSLTVPSTTGGKAFQTNGARFNNQVTKEERETLWLILPNVHVAAMEILLVLTHRCDASTLAVDVVLLDQLVWVFASEKDTPQIRTACYQTVAQLLMRSGAALSKSSIDSLSTMIRTCCDDILPVELSLVSSKQTQAKANGNSQQQVTTNADSFLRLSKSLKDPIANFSGLQEAARSLLPVVFANIRSQYLSNSVRARLDRTVILVGHKDAMVASLLNPPPSRKCGKPAASILPLLARFRAGEQDVESLLRPRMPVIRTGSQDYNGGEEEEEEEEEEGATQDGEGEDDHFVGHELDSILETANSTNSGGGDAALADPTGVGPEHQALLLSAAPGLNANDGIDTVCLGTGRHEGGLGGKRAQAEDVPSSPAKRVKVNEEGAAPSGSPTTSIPSILTIPTTLAPAITAPLETAVVDFVEPTTSQASPPPAPPAEEQREDSDEDDIVPLVLGQDTDDESD
ncbi:hypothetical protein BU26DRAFT_516355 [Trematosphaeria pertusa]|uniref:Pre-rRNA-processing protein RIX1 n=1 Tax=Trematosphaeria pertusa TaxID=390896 RepID=A0A6A6IUQ1_9PLEO|nr:uncharacterized protein BU26DRAFT_516355 [Trematosphaeria pertusa]KAF2254116.1 hypothetical protein BU26DRAFT_516355 [Trematosphaeria pertusa]